MDKFFTIDFTDKNNFIYNDQRIKYTDGIFSLQPTDSGFDDTNPYVIVEEKLFAEAVSGLQVTETGDVTYVLVVDGVDQYWDGTAWSASNRTVTQSNSIVEINDNIGTLTGFTSIQVIFFLNSTGTTDSSLAGIRFEYTPVTTAAVVDTITVFFNTRDFSNNVSEIEYTVTPSKRGIVPYKSSVILLPETQTFTTVGGHSEVELVETDNMEGSVHYAFRIGNTRLYKTVPSTTPRVNLMDLPDLV